MSHRPLPPFRGNQNQVVEVMQNEQAVTFASDPKPILATFNVATCIGVAAYGASSRVGLLAHYDGVTDLEESLTELFDVGMSYVQREKEHFDVHLITSYPDDNKGDRERIKEIIHSRSDVFADVTEVIDPRIDRSSIALHTKSGGITAYNLVENIFKVRRVSKDPKAKLVYRPGIVTMNTEPNVLVRGTTTNDFDLFVNAGRGSYFKNKLLFTTHASQALAYAIEYSVKDNAPAVIVALEEPAKYKKELLPGSRGDISDKLDYQILEPIDIADPRVKVFRDGVNFTDLHAYFNMRLPKASFEELIRDSRTRFERLK